MKMESTMSTRDTLRTKMAWPSYCWPQFLWACADTPAPCRAGLVDPCATGTYAVAQLRQGIGLRQCVSHCVLVSKRAPKSAAEMLPMVTDMFIQCRNVLSLAAHEAQTQAHQSFAPSLSWAHQ